MRESFVTMNSVFRLSTCAFAVALLTFSVGSHALTLGRARGAAIVAQPLSISIAVSANADEDVSDLCFDADVFYGESKVEGAKVTVTSDAPVSGQNWLVRIASRLPVDEPVVTVYLRSTCAGKASRRYVLLADVAPDGMSAVTMLPATPAASVSSSKSLGAWVDKPAATVGPLPATAQGPGAKKVRERAVPEKSVAAASGRVPSSKSAVSSKSRLKLAPLDLSVERDPTLSSTPELLSTPTDDPQKRGEAIALWRALNLTPEDVMRDSARLQGLEATVRQLGDVSKSSQRQMQELKVGLERAERERYTNPVVLALGGVLLVVLAGGVWLFRRQQQAGRSSAAWWRSDSEMPLPADAVVKVNDAAIASNGVVSVVAGSVVSREAQATIPPASSVDIDIDLHLDVDLPIAPGAPVGSFSKPAHATAPPKSAASSSTMGLRDFMPSMSGSLRAMNTQEMLDIRQQAEFFMTLGQYDDAIALLEGHIADAPDANPAVYLDLLKIFHTLSRKEAFDRYRAEFNAIFTGQVADYKDFTKPSEGLEVYPELCAHLAKLWPSREALEFMEDCLVRKPHSAATMLFELEAFKELLMLHGVANRLVNALDGSPVAFSASKPAAPVASVFHTGPSPLDVSLPVNASTPIAVDFELDMPHLEPVASSNIAVPSDNLIDFDASGLNYSAASDKSRS